MSVIVATLALFVAFIGLWLASANAKKMEAGQRELKKQLTADIDRVKNDVDNRLQAVNRRMESLMEKVEMLAQGHIVTEGMAEDLQQDVIRLRKDLDEVMLRVMPRQQVGAGADQSTGDYR